MPTDAQMARRRKDLIAAEIEARRKAAEYTMGLLAGFDPDSPEATRSVMGPDPTFSGVPGQSEFLRGAPIDSQVTPGDTETILDRRRKPDLWNLAPDMRTEEFDPSDMRPIPKAQPFNPADMVPMQRPSLDQADYSADVAGTTDWMRNQTFDLRRGQRDRELGDYRRKQRLLREQRQLRAGSDAGTWTPTLDQLIQTQDIAPYRDEVVQEASPESSALANIPDIPAPADADIERQGLIPRTVPVYPGAKDAMVENPSGIARSLNMSVDARQRNFNRNQQDWERYGGPEAGSLGGSGAVTRAPTTQRKTSSQVVDYIGQIEKRKRILSVASNIWGTKNNSSTYEANALAKLNEHLGTQALRNLTDADMQSQASIFRALVKNDAPLSVIKSVMGMSLDAPKVTSQLKPIRVGDEWVTYEVFSDGSKKVFARSPIQKQTTETTIKMPKGQTATQEALGKRFAAYIGDALYGDEEKMFYQLKRDNMQIGPLLDAVESGAVETGTGQRFFTRIQAALGQFLPASESQRLNDKQAGMAEWWKATSDSFIGLKLAMTKGAISDREMKLFMAMIPQLSMTEEGNIRLLKSMKALNDVALGVQLGAYDWVADLEKRGLAVGDRDATVENMEVKKFIDRRQEIAIKEFDRVAEGLPDTREEAFAIMRDDPQFEQYSEDDLQNYLDKYYPKRSEQ